MRWTFLPLLMGCTAARGTIKLVEAEQDFALARDAEAEDLAVYAWTMAESYMHKSREEYAHADYEAAADMASKAASWSARAKSIAEGMEISPLEGASNILPETLQRQPDQTPFIQPEEEDLVIPLDEEEVTPETPEEDLNIDDILFDDDDSQEGDW